LAQLAANSTAIRPRRQSSRRWTAFELAMGVLVDLPAQSRFEDDNSDNKERA
jgi:hypothetical protein